MRKALDELSVAGATSVEGIGIDTDRLDVFVSGANVITLAGRAHEQDITITGASSYSAAALGLVARATTLPPNAI